MRSRDSSILHGSATRNFLWIPLLICGVFVAILSARSNWRRAARNLSTRRRDRCVRPGNRQLMLLRDAICGNEKWAIERIFGPPPTVAGPADALLWYYPLDARLGHAIAIEFDGDVARDA